MFSFWGRKRRLSDDEREAEISKIKRQTFANIDKTTRKIDTTNKKIINFHHVLDEDDIALKNILRHWR
jgi:hypothetical protein